MGEAMLSCLLSKGVVAPGEVLVSDIDPTRLAALRDRYGVNTTTANAQAVKGCQAAVLAVKPQTLPQVMRDLVGKFQPGQGVLSIVGGAPLKTLCRGLKHEEVARAMPNMPARISEGMSVWTATEEMSEAQKGVVRTLLGALGREIYVADERYLNMATAVSGSGPAYIFLVIEALIDAAVHLGLPRGMATEMVVQTVLGAARSVEKLGKHPAELRNEVASPGGATVEGLLRLEEGGMRALFAEAVIAAYEKTEALGGEK